MASPHPKPTHLKVVTGNPGKRALNKKEPNPKREIPSCPAHLSDVGKVSWGRWTAMLDRIGVLSEADAGGLERLCDCYAEILTCTEIIERDGPIYRSVKEVVDGVEIGLMIRANPAVAMRADADRRFHAYLQAFGMTPSSRSRVSALDADEDEDPLAKFG